MANWDRVKELTEESEKSAGTADEKYSAYTESIEASTKRIQNAWEEFTQTIKGSGIIKVLNDISAAALRLAPAFIKFALPFLVTARASKITNFVTASINKGKEIFGGGVKGLASGFVGKEITQDVTFDESGKPVLSQIETKKGLISSAIDKGAERVASAFNAGDLSNNVSSILKVLQDDRAKKAVGEKGSPAVVSKDGISFETYARLKPLLPEGEKDKDKGALGALRAKIYQEEYAKQVADYEKTQSVAGTSRVKTGRFKYQQLYRTTDQQQFAYDKSRKGYYYLDEKGGFGNLQVSDKMADQAKAIRNQQITNMAITGALTGIASGLMLAQQKSLAGKGTMGGNLASALTGGKMGEQQVEDPAASVSKGIVGGLGSALSVLPPPWNAIGPVISVLGPVVVDFCSTMIHRSELEMKQRVQEAKENLQRLDTVSSLLESNGSILKEELSSSEDYEKLYDFTDSLYDQLYDLQIEGDTNVVKAFNNAFNGLEKDGVAITGTTIESISDLCDKINNGNSDQRKLIGRQLELMQAEETLEELKNSQEEERTSAQTQISKGFYYSSSAFKASGGVAMPDLSDIDGIQVEVSDTGSYNLPKEQKTISLKSNLSTDQKIEALEQVKKKYTEASAEKNISSEEANKAIEEIDSYISSIKNAVETLSKLDKALVKTQVNVGVLGADIYDLTDVELKDLTMDGVVGRVVKALESMGIAVRDNAGYIKDEYQDAIEKSIKSSSEFNALQRADTKTLGQLTMAEEKFSAMLEEQENLSNKYGKSWSEWYRAAKRGELDEEIAKIVYAANPERIEQFAGAWNTTREGLEKLTKEFPDLTTAIGLMSPSEVREYYSVFTDFFEDLAADSALTAANFEKLLSTYPQLLKYYKDGTLNKELIKKANEEQQTAYLNSLLNTAMSSSGVASGFVGAIKDYSEGIKTTENQKLADSGYLTSANASSILKKIGNVKTLNDVIAKANELRRSNDEEAAKALEELVKEYLNYEQVIEWEDPLYKQAKQAQIDSFAEQIENLNQQKEALGKINDERKKEIELIKAKDALENAKKEKVRVYRAGKLMPLSNYIG